MKHMNLMKCLLALCYLGVIAACSSENAIVENVKVTLIRQNEMYCFCKTKCDYFLQNEMY